jgi:hypothetical protein
MRLWLRIALYIGGGGLIITAIDPPGGFTKYGLILLLILAAAYLDRWLSRPHAPGWSGRNVILLSSPRQSRGKRAGPSPLGRERRLPQTVFRSGYQQEVDELLLMLRAEGFRPIMVSHQTPRAENGSSFEIRLPEKEVPKARPLIQFFLVKSAKAPS